MATKAELQSELAQIQEEITRRQTGDLASVERALANSRANPNLADLISSQEQTVQNIKDKIATLEQRAVDVQAQIDAIPDTPAPAPAPTKTVAQTEAEKPAPTKNPPASQEKEVDESAKPAPPIKVDDSKGVAKSPKLRENPLSQFSSYTYNISLYMINPDTYNEYVSGGKLVPKDWQLICRSGGINNTTGVGNESGRAPGFELDYFIDNLKLHTVMPGQGTGSATTSYDFSFQVTEPYGFKFPSKIIEAARTVQANSKIKTSDKISTVINALNTHMLIMIRFYGYDKNGAVINGDSFPQADTTRTDPGSVFERSWPVHITSFDFKLDNKATIYNLKAVIVSEQEALGRYRGFLDDPITVKGRTVSDLLSGSDSENTGKNIKGLVQILNERQAMLVKQDKIKFPDVYKIQFVDSGIRDSVMVDLNNSDKRKTPSTPVTSTSDVTERTASKSRLSDTRTRELVLSKDISVMDAIDQIITQSGYITNALTVKNNDNDVVNSAVTKDYTPTGDPATIAWYKVTPHVKTLADYDSLRNTLACEITYQISRYEIPYVRSSVVGRKSKYPGPHKRYKHWYMSNDLIEKNKHQKEIIGYEQSYNLLYFNINGYGNQAPTAQTGDTARNKPSAGDSNPAGKSPGQWDAVISPVKTFLYSPSDQLNAKITILGDPDYLMTSTARGLAIASARWNGEDGWSINPNTGQAFIEIQFRNAEDYDLSTGLLNPSNDEDTVFWPYPDSVKEAIQGVAYMVWQVISTFSRGMFTQELQTVIPPFDDIKPTETKSDRSTYTKKVRAKVDPSTYVKKVRAKVDPSTYVKKINNTVTPTSLGKGVQTILNPPNIQTDVPSLTQIQNSATYISARKSGLSAPDAIEAAKQAFSSGTSNQAYSAAAPAPITKTMGVVNDDAPGSTSKDTTTDQSRGK